MGLVIVFVQTAFTFHRGWGGGGPRWEWGLEICGFIFRRNYLTPQYYQPWKGRFLREKAQCVCVCVCVWVWVCGWVAGIPRFFFLQIKQNIIIVQSDKFKVFIVFRLNIALSVCCFVKGIYIFIKYEHGHTLIQSVCPVQTQAFMCVLLFFSMWRK